MITKAGASLLVSALAGFALVSLGGQQARAADPKQQFDWQTATPESQGMSSSKLAALWDEMTRMSTTDFLVIRNDRIVLEKYAKGWDKLKPHGTASMAKALVGGMSLAVAITDGKIALDDKAAKFIPQWKDDPLKSKIAIRHLGSHTSGMVDAESDKAPHETLTGWKGEFWKRLDPPHDPFTIARDLAPVPFEPGTRIIYSNPGIGMLMYAVAAAIRDGPDKDARTLLRNRVLRPIGVADSEWSLGYGKTFVVDGLPIIAAWGGASITPRANARIGRLLMRGGNWEGKQLLSREAVAAVTGDAGQPGHAGMGWWTNADGRYPYLPKDAFWGAGAGDQVILVVPSLKLIMVRNGQALPGAPTLEEIKAKNLDVLQKYHDHRARILFKPLMEAITDSRARAAAPYPPSKAITGIVWAPQNTIVRSAIDSDNWPLAWADDDLQYTVYGDGTGFDPKVPDKLSMGFAFVEGGPAHFRGVNIRSATGETKGNGARGKKGSGMLMVDGTLYLLARNAGNSQLASSRDRGKTWTWVDWKFTTSFGYPTFLEFGRNYAGARDQYVYVYSHDGDTAYKPADGMVLARVPQERILERAAFEFFQGLGKDGAPVWSRDVRERGAVFSFPGSCYRCTVSYDAGLKRYFLCQAGDDTKVQAGFGIFEAPDPWGPWSTVYYTPRWDVSPGEMCSFPTKWMSADGKTVHLVFSGRDSFNVRKAVLSTESVNAAAR